MEESNDPTPPRLALLFFRCFCKVEYQEDIEGDLLERFHIYAHKKGINYAKWRFIKDVFLLFQPGLLVSLPSHFNIYNVKRHQLIGIITVFCLASGFILFLVKDTQFSEAQSSIAITPRSSAFTEIFQDNQSVSVSAQEISNKDWAEFLTFIASDVAFSEAYVQSMQPDNWENARPDKKPVYGVSWTQAQEFCKWRSVFTTYQHCYSAQVEFSEMLEQNRMAKKLVTYRLPTESEFNQIKKRQNDKSASGLLCVVSEKSVI
jgi:hypothetical protein